MAAGDTATAGGEVRRRLADSPGRYLRHAQVLWRASRRWTALTTLLVLLDAAVRTLLMIMIGWFAGSVAAAVRAGAPASDAEQVWTSLVAVAAVLLLGPVLQSLKAVTAARCSAAYLAYVLDLLAEAGVGPRGIGHLDSPGPAGRLRAVADATKDWSFLMGIDSTWSVLTSRLAALGALVLLLPWRWWVPLLVAATFVVLSYVFLGWISLAFDRLLQTTGDQRRRAGYLRGLMLGTETAKEVRLFGLADWLGETYRSTWTEAMTGLWRARQHGLGPVLGACLAVAAATGGALIMIGTDVVAGAVTLGGAVMLAQAVLRLQQFGQLGNLSSALTRTTSTLNALAELRRDLGLPAVRTLPGSARPAGSDRGPAAVRLDGVSFGYPSRGTLALDGVSLDIPAGQSVAVVGSNGAGKSTMIKLLCGLYRPDRGAVRVDGADPAADESARSRVAVIFQDFVRYHLPLRDNVRLDADDHDREVLQRALADAGGAGLLNRLDHGWDTVLSHAYDGGTDLSGGQWQRVALARALAAVADGAGVLILDEPTAALDVRAEAELFDRFLEVTRGVTTILVSHRLSSVRHADRIVVLADAADDDRGIVEDGTHQELLARGGRYAAMFRLQARRFARDDSGEDPR
ncbi:ABC transporter ATP-binding protein [Microlunatus parietis]|uniref:ATP-binding cassette subfamily B protein n=1 Tax=Microlunatus parietis TaxID=682979 RepID=A0A7Y9LDT0_9ACTN|nr:ABC transporter ATP-binding protein [Microlunatus parietis]NYE73125.1 ATP-binding cassette subfamily B protein [Microlunatus parietis]